MTIISEQEKHQTYSVIQFVEFLEFIGRAAEVWGDKNMDESDCLTDKIN